MEKIMSDNGDLKPWGVFGDNRPTKLARKLISEGLDPAFLFETLTKEYKIRGDKAKLLIRVLKNQKCIIRNDNLINLYINIPVCPSRCSYCSYISSEFACVEKIFPTYLNCLIQEIKSVKKIISNKPYVVRTIYIGGGTPTVLTVEQLEMLLSELNYPVSEFTVECGRPDTITREKLEVLKRYGVTRISINPQTFSQKTLKTIGRKHTISDVLTAYSLALQMGFIVNMDLIAGLEGESLRTFKNSVKTMLELSPDNVSIHTLSKKCVEDNTESIDNLEIDKMIDFAYSSLTAENYKPYYLYFSNRQLSGLENIGYCKEGKQCLFNVDSMEETCSIIACGANAISKRVFTIDEKVEKVSSEKYLQAYIDNIDEEIKKKIILFK